VPHAPYTLSAERIAYHVTSALSGSRLTAAYLDALDATAFDTDRNTTCHLTVCGVHVPMVSRSKLMARPKANSTPPPSDDGNLELGIILHLTPFWLYFMLRFT